MLRDDPHAAMSGKSVPRKRQRVLLRQSPSTFGVINALLTIQSNVHARFNALVSSFDPLLFESLQPDRMLVEACQMSQGTEDLEELEERINDLEQENLDLSMKVVQYKTIEPLLMSYLKCQERLAELREIDSLTQTVEHKHSPEHKLIIEQRPIELVKLSKMKSAVAKQIDENAALEKQIANLEKRISLMKRKRSFVPLVRTPRRLERKECPND